MASFRLEKLHFVS